MKPDAYLGDGLYASFDGYQIRLYTTRGVGDIHEVFLDESALAQFELFVSELRARAKNRRDGRENGSDGVGGDDPQTDKGG